MPSVLQLESSAGRSLHHSPVVNSRRDTSYSPTINKLGTDKPVPRTLCCICCCGVGHPRTFSKASKRDNVRITTVYLMRIYFETPRWCLEIRNYEVPPFREVSGQHRIGRLMFRFKRQPKTTPAPTEPRPIITSDARTYEITAETTHEPCCGTELEPAELSDSVLDANDMSADFWRGQHAIELPADVPSAYLCSSLNPSADTLAHMGACHSGETGSARWCDRVTHGTGVADPLAMKEQPSCPNGTKFNVLSVYESYDTISESANMPVIGYEHNVYDAPAQSFVSHDMPGGTLSPIVPFLVPKMLAIGAPSAKRSYSTPPRSTSFLVSWNHNHRIPERCKSAHFIDDEFGRNPPGAQPSRPPLNGVSLFYSSKSSQWVLEEAGLRMCQLTNSQKIRRSCSYKAYIYDDLHSISGTQHNYSMPREGCSHQVIQVSTYINRFYTVGSANGSRRFRKERPTGKTNGRRSRRPHFQGGRLTGSHRRTLINVAYPEIRCVHCPRAFRGSNRRRNHVRHCKKVHKISLVARQYSTRSFHDIGWNASGRGTSIPPERILTDSIDCVQETSILDLTLPAYHIPFPYTSSQYDGNVAQSADAGPCRLFPLRSPSTKGSDRVVGDGNSAETYIPWASDRVYKLRSSTRSTTTRTPAVQLNSVLVVWNRTMGEAYKPWAYDRVHNRRGRARSTVTRMKSHHCTIACPQCNLRYPGCNAKDHLKRYRNYWHLRKRFAKPDQCPCRTLGRQHKNLDARRRHGRGKHNMLNRNFSGRQGSDLGSEEYYRLPKRYCRALFRKSQQEHG
ncbi:hypothetical protein BKA63DRAFT_526120 [Paraphoma chrysanthemicola]|nr:hypothetical protein BKA63DRAFT_526120 [Paraphoma chrysanthemicola]